MELPIILYRNQLNPFIKTLESTDLTQTWVGLLSHYLRMAQGQVLTQQMGQT